MKTYHCPRGAIARGFRKISEWRGHYPALIYVAASGEIEIAFSGDATRLSQPDFALRIREARCSDDLPASAAQLRRWLAEGEAALAEAESEPAIETFPNDDSRGRWG